MSHNIVITDVLIKPLSFTIQKYVTIQTSKIAAGYLNATFTLHAYPLEIKMTFLINVHDIQDFADQTASLVCAFYNM